MGMMNRIWHSWDKRVMQPKRVFLNLIDQKKFFLKKGMVRRQRAATPNKQFLD